jgi:hypothetical protein
LRHFGEGGSEDGQHGAEAVADGGDDAGDLADGEAVQGADQLRR